MPPTGDPYNIDWIFASGSNVCVANHKDWFTDFTPFRTTVSGNVEVLGIGTVTLPTKKSNTVSGKKGEGKLILHGVLYAPSLICNVLGSPVHKDYEVDMGNMEIRYRQTGKCVALLENNKLIKVVLAGQQPKKSSLKMGGMYYINATWSDGERARWEAAKKRESQNGAGAVEAKEAPESKSAGVTAEPKKQTAKRTGHWGNPGDPSTRAYSPAEKIWIEKNKKLIRAMMEAVQDAAEEMVEEEEDEIDDSDDLDEDSDGNSFLEELESDPMSHVADHRFTAAQLKWIKKHYKHSGNFMLSYGLKPFDDGDCDEAVSIVKATMVDDE